MRNILIAAIAASIGLAGCSSTGMLQSTDPDAKISGTVMRSAFEPYAVEVTLDGKKYRGEWRTGTSAPDQQAATQLPHKRHIGQVRSVLVAGDGSKLDCLWQIHGETGKGSCNSGNREFPMILK